MGDIAEMMLNGDLCEGCGVYMGSPGSGFPRKCPDCQPTKAERKAENIARHEAQMASLKKDKCPHCGKRVRLVGMADHQRDVHGVAKSQEITNHG